MQQPSTLAKPQLSDFIISAAVKGITTGLLAAALYLLVLSILIAISIGSSYYSEPFGTFIAAIAMNVFWVWYFGGSIGLIPTLLLGGITGALLGWLVYRTHGKLPKKAIVLIAHLICTTIVVCLFVFMNQVGIVEGNWAIAPSIPAFVIYIVIAGPTTAKVYQQLESYQQEL